MNYYHVTDLDNKVNYYIGKTTEAKRLLPMCLEKLKNNRVCIWGDESHGWLEDKYDHFEEGFQIDEAKEEYLELSKDLFYKIFDTFSGKELNSHYEDIVSKFIKELI